MKLYKGNDLQYNTYVRKIEKLTKGANLDIEGFRDFMKNINKLNDSKSENMKSIYYYLYINNLIFYRNYYTIT